MEMSTIPRSAMDVDTMASKNVHQSTPRFATSGRKCILHLTFHDGNCLDNPYKLLYQAVNDRVYNGVRKVLQVEGSNKMHLADTRDTWYRHSIAPGTPFVVITFGNQEALDDAYQRVDRRNLACSCFEIDRDDNLSTMPESYTTINMIACKERKFKNTLLKPVKPSGSGVNKTIRLSDGDRAATSSGSHHKASRSEITKSTKPEKRNACKTALAPKLLSSLVEAVESLDLKDDSVRGSPDSPIQLVNDLSSKFKDIKISTIPKIIVQEVEFSKDT